MLRPQLTGKGWFTCKISYFIGVPGMPRTLANLIVDSELDERISALEADSK